MNHLKRIVRYLLMVFYSKILFYKLRVKVHPTVYISKKTTFAGNNVIHSGVNIVNSILGHATYLGKNCIMPNVVIGSYCSIAGHVEVLPYTHPTSKYVSTHPAFFSLLKQAGFTYAEKQLFQEELFFDKEKGINVKIGNDVWIGANVLIIGGVEIGDGAVVAAGSIITKNVPNYAIVGGIPAKVIRYRFNEEQITFLSKIKWWKKTPKWLSEHAELFSDIENFCFYNKY
jgi:acetyltransferase-like isoleucine patch superfamily enzyme